MGVFRLRNPLFPIFGDFGPCKGQTNSQHEGLRRLCLGSFRVWVHASGVVRQHRLLRRVLGRVLRRGPQGDCKQLLQIRFVLSLLTFSLLTTEDFWLFPDYFWRSQYFHSAHLWEDIKPLRSLRKESKTQKSSLITKEKVNKVFSKSFFDLPGSVGQRGWESLCGAKDIATLVAPSPFPCTSSPGQGRDQSAAYALCP